MTEIHLRFVLHYWNSDGGSSSITGSSFHSSIFALASMPRYKVKICTMCYSVTSLRCFFFSPSLIAWVLMGLPETNTAIDFYIGTLHFVNWRLFLIICSIPAFLSSVSFLFLPESPAFLYLVRWSIAIAMISCFSMSLNWVNYYRISGSFRVVKFSRCNISCNHRVGRLYM